MSNIYIPCGETYYGGYRTRTFADIFPSFDEFLGDFAETSFAAKISTNNQDAAVDMELVYYLLYARYGNSHTSFSDENQFIYNIFSTIFMYGPSWAVRLSTQKKIREAGDEIFLGGQATYNHAYNPSTFPNEGDLQYINEQNKTLYTKSKLEGYANLLALVETDVTEEFISKFRKFFRIVGEPDYPLLYSTEVE